ncbi:hypothetical protein QQ008_24980 [Fulvivirgaceae bacterium BMA10]|uniref:Lipoprotein n=1 Tax=Splendidivirga corallicola TaxID=3051826 RepID=A0ABT8KV72_9BACT|nr:hypothetical protein [Fulvivirgaceae bacterium BMA10]
MRITFYLLMLILFAGCLRDQVNNDRSTHKLEYTFLKDENHTNPLIREIWKSIGNGYYLEVREDSILLYSYTKSFCYKEKNDYLEGLLNAQSQFEVRQDTIGIYLTD